MNNLSIKLILIGSLSFLFSCAPSGSQERGLIFDVSSELHVDNKIIGSLSEVLVLPVFVRESNAKSRNLSLNTLGIPDPQLTEQLIRALDIYTDLTISNSYLIGAKSDQNHISGVEIPQDGISPERLFKLAKEVQKASGAPNVLFALLDRSDNRTGSSMGSERSSMIQYRISVYNAASSSVIWSSAYKSKEGTLSDNLLSAKTRVGGGLKFHTVSDLINAAFRGTSFRLDEAIKQGQSRRPSINP